MNDLERKLAAKLLHMAAESFGRHGCNDFDLVRDGGLTKEEASQILESMFLQLIKDESLSEEAQKTQRDIYIGKTGVTYDYMLMHWLADKISE